MGFIATYIFMEFLSVLLNLLNMYVKVTYSLTCMLLFMDHMR